MLTRRRVGAIARRAPGWRGVLVLNYHRVGDRAGQPWDRSLWSASESLLERHLDVLATEAEVIGPCDLEAALGDRTRARRVMITFDDGYRDNFDLAYPLLRKHGLTATFFLATGFLDAPKVAWWDEIAWMVRRSGARKLPRGDWLAESLPLDTPHHESSIGALTSAFKALPSENAEAFLDHLAVATGSGRCGRHEAEGMWMSWDMAREMARNGMSIGGHTVTHPVLSRVSLEGQEHEIAGCALRIEQELGEPMRWFAYPVGSDDAYTDDTKRILERHGVELAFNFRGGLARFSRWRPLDVRRADPGQDCSAALLRAAVWLPVPFLR